jgi:hypothetical protein
VAPELLDKQSSLSNHYQQSALDSGRKLNPQISFLGSSPWRLVTVFPYRSSFGEIPLLCIPVITVWLSGELTRIAANHLKSGKWKAMELPMAEGRST